MIPIVLLVAAGLSYLLANHWRERTVSASGNCGPTAGPRC